MKSIKSCFNIGDNFTKFKVMKLAEVCIGCGEQSTLSDQASSIYFATIENLLLVISSLTVWRAVSGGAGSVLAVGMLLSVYVYVGLEKLTCPDI
jgi:hypothetical protein